MDVNEKTVIVSQGNRPLWQIIIGSFFYTIMLCLVALFFYLFYKNSFDLERVNEIIAPITLAISFFMAGLGFTLVTTIYIDLEKEKLRTEYAVGMIKINYYSPIPKLEYVSIFKNPKSNIFLVNLWYKGNKHFEIIEFDYFSEAFEFGLLFSNKLNLDLLDATEKGNSKWVDKKIV